MTTMETLDLQTRVARYETAVEELRAAHQDVRNVLHDQVLYARWHQLGADLGFVGVQPAAAPAGQQQDPHAVNGQMPQMAESWAS